MGLVAGPLQLQKLSWTTLAFLPASWERWFQSPSAAPSPRAESNATGSATQQAVCDLRQAWRGLRLLRVSKRHTRHTTPPIDLYLRIVEVSHQPVPDCCWTVTQSIQKKRDPLVTHHSIPKGLLALVDRGNWHVKDRWRICGGETSHLEDHAPLVRVLQLQNPPIAAESG